MRMETRSGRAHCILALHRSGISGLPRQRASAINLRSAIEPGDDETLPTRASTDPPRTVCPRAESFAGDRLRPRYAKACPRAFALLPAREDACGDSATG